MLGAHELRHLPGRVLDGGHNLRGRAAVAHEDDVLVPQVYVLPPARRVEDGPAKGVESRKVGLARVDQLAHGAVEELAFVEEDVAGLGVTDTDPPAVRLLDPMAPFDGGLEPHPRQQAVLISHPFYVPAQVLL